MSKPLIKTEKNTIKIAFERPQTTKSFANNRNTTPTNAPITSNNPTPTPGRPLGGHGGGHRPHFTLAQIRKQLFGYRLVDNPLEICDGADIKYIRIDGPGEYLFRDGGYLFFNAGDKFRLISRIGRASWDIFTDPAKNIIFYFYNPNMKGVLSGQCKFIPKQELEDTGKGVLSLFGGGKISKMINNSDEQADPREREVLMKQMFGGKISYDYEKFAQINAKTGKEKKERKVAKKAEESKVAKKAEEPIANKPEGRPAKEVLNREIPSKERYNIESPPKKEKRKVKAYEYESSYSDPEYSYSSNSTRKVTIRRNNPVYTSKPQKPRRT
jgi:hypothetical protein